MTRISSKTTDPAEAARVMRDRFTKCSQALSDVRSKIAHTRNPATLEFWRAVEAKLQEIDDAEQAEADAAAHFEADPECKEKAPILSDPPADEKPSFRDPLERVADACDAAAGRLQDELERRE